jgi:hypothetical protein
MATNLRLPLTKTSRVLATVLQHRTAAAVPLPPVCRLPPVRRLPPGAEDAARPSTASQATKAGPQVGCRKSTMPMPRASPRTMRASSMQAMTMIMWIPSMSRNIFRILDSRRCLAIYVPPSGFLRCLAIYSAFWIPSMSSNIFRIMDSVDVRILDSVDV